LAAALVVLTDQLARLAVLGVRAPAGTYVPNPGLALGIWAAPPIVLMAGSIAVLGIFLAVVGRWAVQVGISPMIPGVIAGGALANVIDRAQFGVVRDFLTTPFGIVIDVGDLAILVGIAALGIALALRVRYLRSTSSAIRFDARRLRALVVTDVAHGITSG
jgi:lipoprotein signal peptidase